MPSPASLQASPANRDPTNLQYGEPRNRKLTFQECQDRKGATLIYNLHPELDSRSRMQESKSLQSPFQHNN